MGNCYSVDHIAEDHIHTDLTCDITEPKQKYRLGTVSNRLLGNRLLKLKIECSEKSTHQKVTIVKTYDRVFIYAMTADLQWLEQL